MMSVNFISTFFLDLLGEGGLLTDDVLLSALGDDVNFDLIDDINQQQTNLDAGYQNVSLEDSRHDEQGFVSSIGSASVPQGQFEVDPCAALSASSSDPKLFFPPSPNASNIGIQNSVFVRKDEKVGTVSSMPIQLSAQQFAALQQQQMLQVMSNNEQSNTSVISLSKNCSAIVLMIKNVIYRLLQEGLQPLYILNSLNKNKIRLYLPSLELFIKMYKRYLRIH